MMRAKLKRQTCPCCDRRGYVGIVTDDGGFWGAVARLDGDRSEWRLESRGWPRAAQGCFWDGLPIRHGEVLQTVNHELTIRILRAGILTQLRKGRDVCGECGETWTGDYPSDRKPGGYDCESCGFEEPAIVSAYHYQTQMQDRRGPMTETQAVQAMRETESGVLWSDDTVRGWYVDHDPERTQGPTWRHKARAIKQGGVAVGLHDYKVRGRF